MLHRLTSVLSVSALLVACADGDTPTTTFNDGDGGSGGTSTNDGAGAAGAGTTDGGAPGTTTTLAQGGAGAGGESEGGGGSAPISDTQCPTGSFVNAIDAEGLPVCLPIAPLVRDIVEENCSVYLGWRDECNGCTTAPTKWGHAGGTTCANGAGGDNTCSTATLGGESVRLFGLNFDGDVDGNDKIYASLNCRDRTVDPHPGPCAEDELAVAINPDGSLTCRSIAASVLGFVRQGCSLYLGWRDECDACTTIPTKAGEVSSTACTVQGTDDTCSVATLGGESVQLLGINPDGDVDGNDKFFIGMRCADPPPPNVETAGACAAGSFMSGFEGTIATCETVGHHAHETFTSSCDVFFGWRDECNGCTTAPAKWGKAGVGTCTVGAGGDNTCSNGPNGIRLFGLNLDGDLDGNDKLYAGLSCK